MSAQDQDVEMLRQSANGWVRDRAALSPGRAGGIGVERSRQAEFAQMGWSGAAIAPENGGSGLGWSGLGALLCVLGQDLVPSALLPSTLLADALAQGGSPLRGSLLPLLAEGRITAALAIDEGARHAPRTCATTASRSGGGWRLEGRKSYVPGGMLADWLLVAADTGSEGQALFAVESGRVSREPRGLADGRDYAELRFAGLELPAEARLGGERLLHRILDLARIGTAAEMLGSAERAFEITIGYLKLRRQFGQPIGAFQALQHRAARMRVEIELARSCVGEALAAIDAGDEDLPRLASLAKTICGDALHLVSNEIVQLHGGIGMTEDHVAGLYLKRARVAEALYGNSAFHADRYARLSGF